MIALTIHSHSHARSITHHSPFVYARVISLSCHGLLQVGALALYRIG